MGMAQPPAPSPSARPATPPAHGSRPHIPATGLATEESSTSHDDDRQQPSPPDFRRQHRRPDQRLLARPLRLQVTLVELAPHLRAGGQALDVRGPGLEVAERMDILATIRDHRTRLTGMSQVDSTGRETFRSTERTITGGRLDSPDVEIMRDDLCRVLYQAVGKGVGSVDYLFDDAIASLTQDASGVDVTFHTAAARRFDL